jgi:hypothetical protein
VRAPPRTAVPAPRETALLPRFTAVPRPDDRGGETTAAAVRTFPADAAVGLLSRDRSTLRGTLGGGVGAGALRALASEAAVGAKRPDEGREVRGAAVFLDAGVFGRASGGTCGVGDLTLRGSVGGALRVPGPFGGVRGVGVLARLARLVAAGDGRAPVDGVDFEGDAGVFVGLDTAAAAGRDADADDRALVAGTGAVIEAGVGAGMSLAGIALVSAVGGVVGAGAVSGMGAGCVSTRPGGALSEAGGGDGVASTVVSGAGEMVGFGGRLPLAPMPLVLPFVLTGGHSRGMRGSSLAGSAVLLEAALVAREGGPGVAG